MFNMTWVISNITWVKFNMTEVNFNMTEVTSIMTRVTSNMTEVNFKFIDLGIIVPFAIFVGVLMLKRNAYGFLFSTVALILVLNIGFSVVAGQSILGVMTNTFSDQLPGIAVFSVFMFIDTFILVKIFRSINETSTGKLTNQLE